MRIPVSLMAVVVAAGVVARAEGAPSFYSVDVTNDMLVRIDASSGQVINVGSLGRDVTDTDLAWLDGKLYAVSTGGGRADLLQLLPAIPDTGAAIHLGGLSQGASAVTVAESLAVRDGRLLVGYSTQSNITWSLSLGELSLTGEVTQLASVHPMDLDGMATGRAGKVFAIDAEPGDGVNWLHSVEPSSLLGSYSLSEGSVNDLAFADGQMYGIANAPDSLHRIDPADGSKLSAVALVGGGRCLGLAPVPEPATGFLLLVGGLAIVRRGRR